VSVVIPAYRADATLAECVASVLAQDLGEAFEVIVVASGIGVRGAAGLGLPDDPRLVVDPVAGRLGAAAARNRAARTAAGRLLVFTDADVVAPAGWLRALTDASRAAGDGAVVAGSVANGTPSSRAGTAEYLVQFSSLAPSAVGPGHGATCNLLVPRVVWDELGPFPEDMGGGEDTLLTVAAAGAGRLRWVPAATVLHRNRTGIGAVLAHQRAFGAFTADLADRCRALPHRRLLRAPWLVPVAVAGRMVAVTVRAPATFGSTAEAARRLPAIALAWVAVAAWGAGLAGELLAMRRHRRSP
jgi:glycosyltransferase involved in cell wall biosynthesis